MRINVTRSSMPAMDEYMEEIRSLWDSHWLTNNGEKSIALKAELEKYLDCPHAELFCNGHLALEALLRAMGLHGEVITTPFTFASTTHAIVRCGLTPVFGDICPGDCTLDPDKAEALITDKTCAILPVHVYGRLCHVERFEEISRKYGVPVIYDAAHAFGVTKNGVSAAAMGYASMFSFHATKVFHTIEGGCITTGDADLCQRLCVERNFGIAGEESTPGVGGNAKMNEFQAAMGLCNLRRIDGDIAARKLLYELYEAELSGLVDFLPQQEGVVSNYAYLPVFFSNQAQRDQVYDQLKQQQIFTRKYFYPLVTQFECYQGKPGFDPAATPVAAQRAAAVLTLPLYPDLTEEDVQRICAAIRGVIA
ncbi:MAG: DegT/DnrJ/EryC1/StrS family aminotransferase [Clostridiales bacterium]|nr:DegT/DnrJ/EryC1/StrS family aminotransferase [Clostridiales bacterium]